MEIIKSSKQKSKEKKNCNDISEDKWNYLNMAA